MTQTELTYLCNHPAQISEKHLEEISEILDAFPYFQAPRVIQLKGLKNSDSFRYNNALKRTAAHTIDRGILFNFITNYSFDKETSNEVILEQIEVVNPVTIQPLKISKKEVQTEPKEKSPEEILEIGTPIQFQKHEPHSFNEWMQLISKKPIKRTSSSEKNVPTATSATHQTEMESTVETQETPTKKSNKLSLIDKFIETSPKIKPVKKSAEIQDISKGSSEQNDNLMTETLAKVYVEQKKYDNAIQAYRILSLKYPEKSVFFADRIKAITILQRNKS